MASQTEIAAELLRNKLLSTTNFLNYTGLTYKDIVDAINNRLSQDRNFDNFRESAIAQLMLEMFAGTADLVNYLLERRAEESFFDSAQLQSSVIALSRNLAYDIQRPVPANTTMKVKITGDITYAGNGFTAQDVADGLIKVQIPQYTRFEVSGKSFILKNLFSYTLSASDIAQGPAYEKELIINADSSKIELIQGEIKYAKFASVGNDQHNAIFQTYRLSDPSFSNIYGSKDYVTGAVTKVGIGSTPGAAFEDTNLYNVDRRSLLTQEFVNFYDFNSDVAVSQKICLIRTATDGGIELKFGDDKYVAKGLKGAVTANNNIFVQYLSTLGSVANEVGVIGQTVDVIDTVNNYGINVEFELLSNIIGGADIESNESIKVNAPGIFYSLDRLVTKRDYITFIESLTSPINVNNAIAWGEQEEILNMRTFTSAIDVPAVKKLFNVVLFSCVASMYNVIEGASSVKTDMTDVVLDSDYNEFQMPSQNYMTVFVNQNTVEQIKFQQELSTISSASEYTTIVGQDLTTVWSGISTTDYNTFKARLSQLSIGLVNFNKNTLVTTQVSAFSNYTSAYSSYADLITGIETSFINLGLWDSVDVILEQNKFKFKIFGDAENAVSAVHDSASLMYFNPNSNNVIGLSQGTVQNTIFSNTGFAYSTKIDDVVADLNQRSQLTVKNVYISPIIQDFKLTGNVYIKQLANRDSIQSQINDRIYLWFDDNADFNLDVYKSNIVQLIDDIPNVLYTDVRIEPSVDALPYGQTSWLNTVNLLNGTHERYAQLVTLNDKLAVGSIITTAITNFMNKYRVFGTDYRSINTLSTTFDPYTYVYADYLNWSNKINERVFYTELVKNIVDSINTANIVTINGILFTKTANFYSLMNDMHKDLMYIIKFNMLDSHGNIAREHETLTISGQEVTSYVRGGYSMGNEIVRVTINTNVLYKS